MDKIPRGKTDWQTFEKFLKSQMPWVVLDLKQNEYIKEEKYAIYVAISDLEKWEQEERIILIYQKDTESIRSIFLRPQLPGDFRNYAEMVNDVFVLGELCDPPVLGKPKPQRMEQENSRQNKKSKQEEFVVVNLKQMLSRNQIITKNQYAQAIQGENEAEEDDYKLPSIVNSHVLNDNNNLHRKFQQIYKEFEKENK